MTRLSRILFAGTVVPAMALTPLAAVAQAPLDQLKQHAPAAPHPAAPHPAMPGGAAHPAAPPAAAPRPSAEAAPARPAAPHPSAAEAAPPHAAHPAAAEGAPPRAAPPRPAAAEAAPQHAPAARPAEHAAERPAAAGAEGHPHRDAAGANDRTRGPGAPPAAPATEHAATPPRAPEHNAAGAPPPAAAPTAAAPSAAPPAASSATREHHRGGPPVGAADRGAPPPGAAPGAGAPPPGPNGARVGDRGGHGIGPGGAAAIGAAAGFAGGFLAATAAQNLGQIRNDRHEVVEDGRTYIREPGRTIVEDGDRSFIVHDENARFRDLGYDVRRERRGNQFVDTVDRPDGTQILTYTDASGRMLRRVRRTRDGREFVLIDNGFDGRVRSYQDDVVDLPPPPMRIPHDRYDLAYQGADEGLIYDTLVAPPLAPPPRRYTLDQIRYSPDVRRYVRSVDINTINFDSGSWIVPGAATGKLEALARAIQRAVQRNPNSVFLVEGYTDATGNPTDNLSLSDRRAQSVATILTKDFNVPPENLTTQGYGQQNLKVDTQGPSVENRRVVVQNITQLLASGNQGPQE